MRLKSNMIQESSVLPLAKYVNLQLTYPGYLNICIILVVSPTIW